MAEVQVEAHVVKRTQILVGSVVLLFALVGIILAGGMFLLRGETIYNGISVNGIDLSGRTLDEATEDLRAAFENEIYGKNIRIFIGQYERTVSVSELSDGYDFNATVEKAYSIGRDKKFLANFWEVLSAKVKNRNIALELMAHEGDIKNIMRVLTEEYTDGKLYKINEAAQTVLINSAQFNDMVDVEESYERFLESAGTTGEDVSLIVSATQNEEKIAELLYSLINRAPKDASPGRDEDGKFKIKAAVPGVEVAQNTILGAIKGQSGKGEISVPIVLVPAEVDAETLQSRLFRDQLSEYSTTFSTAVTGRTQNIRQAAKSIDGLVLFPGDEFSFNETLGERTARNGYAIAKVYTSGGIVDGIGGGICQVSSTLYSAVLYADLQTTERTNHNFTVSYLPTGQDATVSYGTLDYRFRNNQEYPIKISAAVNGGKLTIGILGTNMEPNKKIEIENVLIATHPFKVQQSVNPNAGVTRNVVTQSGMNGKTVDTYIIRKNGETVTSRTFLHRSTYSSLTQTVLTPQSPPSTSEGAEPPPIVEPQVPMEEGI